MLAALNETHGAGSGGDAKPQDTADGTDEAPKSLENKSKKLKKRVQ